MNYKTNVVVMMHKWLFNVFFRLTTFLSILVISTSLQAVNCKQCGKQMAENDKGMVKCVTQICKEYNIFRPAPEDDGSTDLEGSLSQLEISGKDQTDSNASPSSSDKPEGACAAPKGASISHKPRTRYQVMLDDLLITLTEEQKTQLASRLSENLSKDDKREQTLNIVAESSGISPIQFKKCCQHLSDFYESLEKILKKNNATQQYDFFRSREKEKTYVIYSLKFLIIEYLNNFMSDTNSFSWSDFLASHSQQLNVNADSTEIKNSTFEDVIDKLKTNKRIIFVFSSGGVLNIYHIVYNPDTGETDNKKPEIEIYTDIGPSFTFTPLDKMQTILHELWAQKGKADQWFVFSRGPQELDPPVPQN